VCSSYVTVFASSIARSMKRSSSLVYSVVCVRREFNTKREFLKETEREREHNM
jgi:hypothetical protein